MGTRRVLFVDDDQEALRALYEKFRAGRFPGWEARFAAGGEAALSALSRERHDALVTDALMPGMDGAALLAEAVRAHPGVLRVLARGPAERGLPSVSAAQQFAGKPLDPAVVLPTLARACALRDLLADNSLQRVVAQVETLPSLPHLYTRMIAEMATEDGSLQKVGAIISQDIAMTAKVLQLANSAWFSPGRHVATPAQAAVLLGFDTLRALVLSSHVFSQFQCRGIPEAFVAGIRGHSLGCGVLAKTIAATETREAALVDDAFIAGLLHDAGKLVLASRFPDLYRAVLEDVGAGLPLTEAERGRFGVTHAEAGAYLMGLWGLPEAVVEALAFHHAPAACPGEGFAPLTAVHAASAFEHELAAAPPATAHGLDPSYMASPALAPRVPFWREVAARALRGASPE